MQVKYYNSGNSQWESANPLPPEEIYIGDTPPAQGINAKLWLDTSVTGLLPASYAVADNCEQTVAGQAVLDAHQGYLLQNQINNLSNSLFVSKNIAINDLTISANYQTNLNLKELIDNNAPEGYRFFSLQGYDLNSWYLHIANIDPLSNSTYSLQIANRNSSAVTTNVYIRVLYIKDVSV